MNSTQKVVPEPEVGAQPHPVNTPEVDKSEIRRFYQGRSVLITGGSGFVGKVLIEKLLRTCNGIGRIFVLIRPKRDKQPNERINEILKEPLFDQVRHFAHERIVIVEGDVTQPRAGINDERFNEIVNEVTVIYHSAATVKFDEPLKQSVEINLCGTKNIIGIARRIPNLAALVHVSTAYSNCDRAKIDEHVYPVNIEPEHLMNIAQWLDQEAMQALKSNLLEAKPNTYTFTKALAEWLLVTCARDLPVVICRPSIVVSSWKEPFSGWIDNLNGPTGVILGAGKGLIRSMYANPKVKADLVPVDSVINMLITSSWFANEYSRCKAVSLNRHSGLEDDNNEILDEVLRQDTSLNGRLENEITLVQRSELKIHDDLSSSSRRASNPADDGYGSWSSDDGDKSTRTSSLKSLPSEEDVSVELNRSYSSVESEDNNEQDLFFSGGHTMNQDEEDICNRNKLTRMNKLSKLRKNIEAKLKEKKLPENLADVPVFHCTSGTTNPITWGALQIFMLRLLVAYPSITTYRYPGGSFTDNQLWDKFRRITLHYIPGYIVDFATRLMGGKPIMVKIFRKFDQAANVLKAFTSREWDFSNENNSALLNDFMSDDDKRLFSFDLRPLDWAAFSRDYVLGVRRYLLKEPIENLQQARANLRRTYLRNLTIELAASISAYFLIVKPILGHIHV